MVIHKNKHIIIRNLLITILPIFAIIFGTVTRVTNAIQLTDIYEIRPTLKCAIPRDASNDVLPMQGVYFIDEHAAVYSGYKSDDDKTVLTLVNLDSCKVVDKNKTKVMGHANDITYNSRNNNYYVTTGRAAEDIPSTYKKIFIFKITNNNISVGGTQVETAYRLSAFDYDSDHNRYYGYGDNNWYTLPRLGSAKDDVVKTSGKINFYYDNFLNQDGEKTKFVAQGIAYGNGNLYFAMTISATNSDHQNDSFVMVYDAKTGDYKYTMHFPSSFFWGHLEGISVKGNKMLFGLNVHDSNPNGTSPNQSFMVYNGINDIEEHYRAAHDIPDEPDDPEPIPDYPDDPDDPVDPDPVDPDPVDPDPVDPDPVDPDPVDPDPVNPDPVDPDPVNPDPVDPDPVDPDPVDPDPVDPDPVDPDPVNPNPKDEDEDDEKSDKTIPSSDDDTDTGTGSNTSNESGIHVPNTGQSKTIDGVITAISLSIIPLSIILIALHIHHRNKNHRVFD